MQRPDAVVEVTILLWERLAIELSSIIGDEGFQSLYARSCNLNKVAYPWLLIDHVSQTSVSRFEGLQISLKSRDIVDASTASKTLLITFVDILALLIGDQLTASILLSAWNENALNIVEKGNSK